MKTRNDFVSNSSSSSFVLFGIEFEPQKLLDALRQSAAPGVAEKARKTIDENGEDASTTGIVGDLLDDLLESGTYVIDWEGDGTTVVGRDPCDMKDEETLAEFKKGVTDMLGRLGVDADVKDVKLYRGVDADGSIMFD